MRISSWTIFLVQVLGSTHNDVWGQDAGAGAAAKANDEESVITGTALSRQLPVCKKEVYETTLLITITKDPCRMSPKLLTEFVDGVVEAYNDEQYELCDRFYRRIVDYSFIDICSDDKDSYGRRKLRELQDNFEDGTYVNTGWPFLLSVDYGSSDDTDLFTTNNRRRSLLPFPEMARNEQTKALLRHETRGHDQNRNLPGYKCTCAHPGGGKTNGITAQELEEIANDILLHLTDGRVAVTDLFEATTGCNAPRVEVAGEIIVTLNVDVNSLTKAQLKKLEKDCLLGYNNFIINSCPNEYNQVQVCMFEPIAPMSGRRRLQGGDELSGLLGGGGDPGFSGWFEQNIRRQRHLQQSSSIVDTNGETIPRFLPQSQVNTLPEDLCVCRLGAEHGTSPSTEQFAVILNETGIVDSVIEVSPVQCRGPKTFSQIIPVIANGDLRSNQVSDDLGDTIRATINLLSKDLCIKNHFFIYSLELIWKEKKHGPGCYDRCWALLYRAQYAAYDVKPHQYVPLYRKRKIATAYGRSLEFDNVDGESGSNPNEENTSPDVQDVQVPSRRELFRILRKSTCYCSIDTPEIPFLTLCEVNEELGERISDGAVSGVTFAVITH